MRFDDYASDFYHYMVTEGGLTPKTSHDYISRLRFLATSYDINDALTKDAVTDILAKEQVRQKQESRRVYSSRKAISDFSAGLNKFLAFLRSDYHKRMEDSIISEINKIEQSASLKETEKREIVLSRIGQGHFRKDLIRYWGGCAVSGFPSTWMLVASHIKPWRASDNEERLDVYNGLLLLPNLDKLFDRGYISFNMKGHAIYSKLLSKEERQLLRLPDNMRLSRLSDQHKPYLRYHNEFCLL